MKSQMYTSIEQSKKLKELGIDVNSADMHWQYIEEDNGQLQWFYFPKDFILCFLTIKLGFGKCPKM